MNANLQDAARAAMIDFAVHYGPRCRDCADEDGVCPATGIGCGERQKAVEFVVDALIYGRTHGFIPAATPDAIERRGNIQPAAGEGDVVERAVAAERAAIVRHIEWWSSFEGFGECASLAGQVEAGEHIEAAALRPADAGGVEAMRALLLEGVTWMATGERAVWNDKVRAMLAARPKPEVVQDRDGGVERAVIQKAITSVIEGLDTVSGATDTILAALSPATDGGDAG